MVTESFEITYAAHTATCTFLLDSEGICRRIVMAPTGKRQSASRNAARCVGAQYVASLDPSVPGCLVEMPRVGVAMLFARVDERGRVALVRTGVVTRFEAKREKNHDPFEDTGQVSTSAPKLPPDPRTPRMPRVPRETALPEDPYDGEMTERTQPIQALRPETLAHALSGDRQSRPPPPESGFDITSEYESEAGARRSTKPSQVSPSLLPTLRTPPVPVPPDESDPYVANGRGVLPPRPRSEPPPPPPPPSRSDPYANRMKSDRAPSPRALEQGHRDTPRVQTQWTGNKAVVSRRRGDR